MFGVILELAFITKPFVIYFAKISKVETIVKLLRSVVKNMSFSIKRSFFPEPFVCKLTVRIVHLTVALHFVIFPLAFIVASVMKLKFSMTLF